MDILIVQSLFDHTQMFDQHEIVKHSFSSTQMKNDQVDILVGALNLMSQKLKNSLLNSRNSSSYFVPACITHMFSTRRFLTLF